jgi:putative transposase
MADGVPMKSYTLKAKMEALGITSSISRPRVSNDNPCTESIFRTLKHWPSWLRKGFASIDIALLWVKRFIDWYCHVAVHRHSGIKFVTPAQRHQGKDKVLLLKRHQVYLAARAVCPERWRGETRNWGWDKEVQLNPDRPLNQKNTENL